jgi:hypothetical protein
MKSGLSYELDSDINYYHHFKIGELIVCEVSDNKKYEGCWPINYKRVIEYNKPKWYSGGIELYRNTYQANKVFTLNWDSIKSEKLNFVDLIRERYLEDVTKCVKRDWKLELIGI